MKLTIRDKQTLEFIPFDHPISCKEWSRLFLQNWQLIDEEDEYNQIMYLIKNNIVELFFNNNEFYLKRKKKSKSVP